MRGPEIKRLHRADPAGQIALHTSHGIGMDQPTCGRPVEKYLYFPVLDLGGLLIFGGFHALHGRPEPGPRRAVARVGITAQTNTLFGTLEIRQFGSFDLAAILDQCDVQVQRKV